MVCSWGTFHIYSCLETIRQQQAVMKTTRIMMQCKKKMYHFVNVYVSNWNRKPRTSVSSLSYCTCTTSTIIYEWLLMICKIYKMQKSSLNLKSRLANSYPWILSYITAWSIKMNLYWGYIHGWTTMSRPLLVSCLNALQQIAVNLSHYVVISTTIIDQRMLSKARISAYLVLSISIYFILFFFNSGIFIFVWILLELTSPIPTKSHQNKVKLL